jgi:hypothetical protein
MTTGQTDEHRYVEGFLAAAQEELTRRHREADWLSLARVAYLLAAIAILLWLRVESMAWIAAALAPFVGLVRAHRLAERREFRARGMVAAARGALARMDGDWGDIPPLQPVDLTASENASAIRDLDVYGEHSLFRLMDVVQPAIGGAVLMRRLLGDPDSIDAIRDRQASVRELRALPAYLLESARLCRNGSRPATRAARVSAFREWCASPVTTLNPVLVLGARVLAMALAAVVIWAIAARRVDNTQARTIGVVLFAQLAIGARSRAHLRAGLRGADDMLPDLVDLHNILRLIVAEPPVDGRFGAIQRDLANAGAVPAFDELTRLFDWNTVRHSPMQNAFANATIGFDAHLASRIDRWRTRFARHLPEWIDLAGEAQALTALATLAYEHPDWTLPVLHTGDGPVLEAVGCGHPLVSRAVRVTNPIELRAPGSALVISGSNMSCKTTYLRAAGLNVLLAQAGGPVCAASMRLRRCRVRTSVRIEDDLAANTSLFFAEVSRIRDIIRDAEDEDAPPVLFLFDEILHGTNARDRREASILVLERLLDAGAAGMITTHDAGVGDVGRGNVTHVHFTDTVVHNTDGIGMSFDYVMRPGPATTTNALRIFEAMGLKR